VCFQRVIHTIEWSPIDHNNDRIRSFTDNKYPFRNGRTDRRGERQTEGQTETDGQKDRSTDRPRETQCHVVYSSISYQFYRNNITHPLPVVYVMDNHRNIIYRRDLTIQGNYGIMGGRLYFYGITVLRSQLNE
jgi:hypothetical protein